LVWKASDLASLDEASVSDLTIMNNPFKDTARHAATFTLQRAFKLKEVTLPGYFATCNPVGYLKALSIPSKVVNNVGECVVRILLKSFSYT